MRLVASYICLLTFALPVQVRAAEVKLSPGFQVVFRGQQDQLVEAMLTGTPDSAQLVVQARNFNFADEKVLQAARMQVDQATDFVTEQLKKQPQYRNLKVVEIKREDSKKANVFRRNMEFQIGKGGVSKPAAPTQHGDSHSQVSSVQSEQNDATWEWTLAERAKINSLKRQVVTRNGLYCVETGDWKATTDISAQFVAELAIYMDIVDGMLRQSLPGIRKWQGKPTIRIFGDKREFETKYGKIAHGKTGGSSANLWVHLCAVNEKERDFDGYPKEKLIHEATHAVMFTAYDAKTQFPSWFQEGVAGYFQSWNPRLPPQANCRQHASRSHALKQMRIIFVDNVSGTPSLHRLITMSSEEFYANDVRQISIHYYAVESFISYLMSTSEGRAELQQMFERGFQGKPLHVDAANHEQPWRKYVCDGHRG